MRNSLAFLGLLGASALLPSCAAATHGDGRDAGGSIRAERIRAHVAFLADDLLEGRGPGTRGGALAIRYLEAQARLAGLEPGAADGSYLQAVPLRGVETQASSTLSLDVGATPLRWLEDFVATDETGSERTEIDAPMVFVGYGISAPEFGWDDYAGVDVRGKVVLMYTNEPGRGGATPEDPALFGGRALTYFGRWTYKYEEAARRGAKGAILIHTEDTAGYNWNVVRNSWGRERPFPADASQALPCAAWVREDVVRSALARTDHPLEELKARAERRGFRAVETGLQARVRLSAKTRSIETYNVLAKLRGSQRPDEAVVLTAHHDHLGVGSPENGDAIYNGAVDNGTGCATVLELARALAAGPQPKRSVLFAWVAAEEGGLRGSEHFARNPTFPPGKIVANLNLDGLPVVGEPSNLAPLGYRRSTLRETVERAAAAMDLGLVEERNPEQGYFFRSDHFNFAKIGVPAISIGAGGLYRGEDSAASKAREEDYRARRYHRPDDEYDPSWDFRGCVVLGELTLRCAQELANGSGWPAFIDGDEFQRAQPARRP